MLLKKFKIYDDHDVELFLWNGWLMKSVRSYFQDLRRSFSNLRLYTARKMSEYRVFLVRSFLCWTEYGEKYGKIRTRKTPYLDTFHTVLSSAEPDFRFCRTIYFFSKYSILVVWLVSEYAPVFSLLQTKINNLIKKLFS